MLEVKNLSVTYNGNIRALKDINIDVNQGELVVLIGANGAGKTTLLKALTGLIKVNSGSFANLDLTGLIDKRTLNRFCGPRTTDKLLNAFETSEKASEVLYKYGVDLYGKPRFAELMQKLSEIDGFSKGTHKGEGLVLDNQEISSEQTDTYKLRIWISDDVNYSNTIDENGTMVGKYNGYTYSLRVKVTSDVIADASSTEHFKPFSHPIADLINPFLGFFDFISSSITSKLLSNISFSSPSISEAFAFIAFINDINLVSSTPK